MKKLKNLSGHLTIILLALVAFGCSPKLSASWTDSDYSDRTFNKIAVVGISNNLRARMEFENTAVALLRENGINAVVGISIFPINMSEEDKEPANLIKIVEENGLDGVITMSLVDTEESTRYQHGENHYYSAGYYRFGNHLVQRWGMVSTPGYYVSTRSYLIEVVLYDLKGELYEEKEILVWKGQSELVDPSSIESAAKSFTKKMVMHMMGDVVMEPANGISAE